jgi:hypothetical protein
MLAASRRSVSSSVSPARRYRLASAMSHEWTPALGAGQLDGGLVVRDILIERFLRLFVLGQASSRFCSFTP